MRRARILIIIVLLGLGSAAFAQEQEPGLQEPLPTFTPYPTYTPYPTPTPELLAPPPAAPAPRPIAGLDPAIMRQADNEINEIYLQISRIQSDRAAVRAPLLQLPSTHAEIPAAALKAAPDPGRSVGIDSWYSNDVELPASMSTSVRVDVYESPRGWGYVIVSSMEYGKANWVRAINYGPETWRDQDWEQWVTD